MQMLNLLVEIQSVLLPFYFNKSLINSSETKNNHATATNNSQFPFVSIFDAVAPYYPIKFTPPPSDPWGITREGLHHSLLEVLTYSTHYNITSTNIFLPEVINDNDDNTNMTTLVAHLFLDRLLIEQHSYDDDQNEEMTTVQDRLDALEDLNQLLLSPFDVDSPSLHQRNMTSKREKKLYRCLSLLSHKVIQEMSNILRRCHEHAAISVLSLTNQEEKRKNKELADFCRGFANRLSYEFELQFHADDKICKNTKSSSLWECFVLQGVRELADIITSSPQSVKGRVSIAYIASLSACGGERTLRLCLDTFIPPLVRILKNCLSLNNDEEQISTAAYGIGVFFASSRLSMEQITKDNIVIHPHPLKPFVSEIIQLLCRIIEKNEVSTQLKTAAVKALESLLVSTPFEIVEREDAESVKNTVLLIAESLVDYLSLHFVNRSWTDDWGKACTRLLGTTIGRSLPTEEKDSRKETSYCTQITLFEKDEDISTFVKDILLPKILTASSKNGACVDEDQYGWRVLACACEVGEKYVAEVVLSHLFDILKEKNQIDIQGEKQVKNITLAISSILRHGGEHPITVFHENGLQLSLIDILSRPRLRDQQDAEISTLLLPEVRDKKRTEAEKAVSK